MSVILSKSQGIIQDLILFTTIQWQIQDFPDGGGATLNLGKKTYYLARFLPKPASLMRPGCRGNPP